MPLMPLLLLLLLSLACSGAERSIPQVMNKLTIGIDNPWKMLLTMSEGENDPAMYLEIEDRVQMRYLYSAYCTPPHLRPDTKIRNR